MRDINVSDFYINLIKFKIIWFLRKQELRCILFGWREGGREGVIAHAADTACIRARGESIQSVICGVYYTAQRSTAAARIRGWAELAGEQMRSSGNHPSACCNVHPGGVACQLLLPSAFIKHSIIWHGLPNNTLIIHLSHIISVSLMVINL